MGSYERAARFREVLCLAFLCFGACLWVGCSSDDDAGKGKPGSANGRIACDAAPQPVTPAPVSGSGPAYLGDDDSDANGIADRDEWGELEFAPVDTDEDGTPDYLDFDDDGDGLLDVRDEKRTEPLSPDENPEPHFLIRGVVETPLGVAPDAARAGDALILRGEGLSCDAVVSFDGSEGPKNAWPVSASDTEIEVVVPEGAGSSVVVISGGHRSDAVDVDVLDAGAPLLVSVQSSALVGQELVLRGKDLSAVTSVFFGDREVTPTAVAADSVTVQVPADGSADSARAVAGTVSGNALPLQLTEAGRATLQAPGGVSATHAAFGSDSETQFASDGTANVEVPLLGLGAVQAFRRQGDTDQLLLSALTAPGQTEVTVSARSTAVALALRASGAERSIERDSLGELLNVVDAVPTVQALEGALSAALAADPGSVWDAPSATLAQQIAEASFDVQTAVDAAVTAGTLKTAPEFPAPVIGPIAKAVINPDTPQFDISVTQQLTNTNVRVTNDTQLPVSVRIHDTERGVRLLTHSTSGFGRSIVGGQGTILKGFASNDADFDQPRGRDSEVQVITPGVAAPQPTDQYAQQTQKNLQLRTVIEKLIWPILTEALGLKIKSSVVFNAFKSQGPGATGDFFDAMDKGDASGAAKVLVSAAVRDLTNVGPITQAILRAGLHKAAPNLVKRLGARAIPVLNAIAAALTAAGTAVAATDFAKTLADMNATPGQLDWTVLFGVSILDVNPKSIKKRDVEVTGIEILGNEFYPSRDSSGKYVIPTVTFRDKDPSGFGSYVNDRSQNKFFISSDGTRIEKIVLPAAYVRHAVGPIEVRVDKGSDNAISADDIQVETDFALTSVTPAVGGEGDTVAVVGKGFESGVRFIFRQAGVPNDAAILVQGTTLSSTATTASVQVPKLTANINQWWLHAEQGGVLGVRTNGLPFSQQGGAYQLVIIGSTDAGWPAYAAGINNNGTVAGVAYSPLGQGKVFTWTAAGGIKTLPWSTGTGGFLWGTPVGINDSGLLIGAFGEGSTVGQLYGGGNVSKLGDATAIKAGEVCGPAMPAAINSGGTIVGYVECGPAGFSPTAYASTWEGHAYLAPSFSGGNFGNTRAVGVNSSGLSVGCANFVGALNDPVVFSGGSATKLTTPKQYSDSCANAVNDSGTIVGYGNNGGASTALMWTSSTAAPTVFTTAPVQTIVDITTTGTLLGGLPNGAGGSALAPIYISNDAGVNWTPVGSGAINVSGTTYQVTEAHGINDLGVIAVTVKVAGTSQFAAAALVPGGS